MCHSDPELVEEEESALRLGATSIEKGRTSGADSSPFGFGMTRRRSTGSLR